MNKLWQAGNSRQLKPPSAVHDLTCEHHNTVSNPSTNKSKHEHYINLRHSQALLSTWPTGYSDRRFVHSDSTWYTSHFRAYLYSLPSGQLSTSVSRSYLTTQTPWRKRSPPSESHSSDQPVTHAFLPQELRLQGIIQFRHFIPAVTPDMYTQISIELTCPWIQNL